MLCLVREALGGFSLVVKDLFLLEKVAGLTVGHIGALVVLLSSEECVERVIVDSTESQAEINLGNTMELERCCVSEILVLILNYATCHVIDPTFLTTSWQVS